MEKRGQTGRTQLRVTVGELEKSRLYSEELGITLSEGTNEEIFKWFLASVLFGARISETIAKNTYKMFEQYRLLTPEKILDAGWEFLVNPVMREGGYVRYDGKTSTQILRNCETLLKNYEGSLNKLHEEARDSDELEERLLEFYGVGPVTVNIFLRELRPFWEKADVEVLPIVKKLANRWGIQIERFQRKSVPFVRLEAGLIRLRRNAKY